VDRQFAPIIAVKVRANSHGMYPTGLSWPKAPDEIELAK
jgi:hypothetical protein